MKILWAALLGLTATAWNFEGDWSSWDETRGVEATKAAETLSYATPGLEAGEVSFYEFRAMGRSESRWMGTNTGGNPEIADLGGISYFDWSRLVGRSEARLTEGFFRTGGSLAPDRTASEDLGEGCSSHAAARAEGRAEAKDTDTDTEPTTSPESRKVGSEGC